MLSYHLEFISHLFKELLELRHRFLSSIGLLPTEKKDNIRELSYLGIPKASSHVKSSSSVSLFINGPCLCTDIYLCL